MALLVLLFVPLSYAPRPHALAPGTADLPFMQALARAWGYGSYRLLVAGFFVCGFHLAFVTVHMPAYLVQCGLTAEAASWSIAIIGLFNIVGSLLSGYLGGKLPKQLLLAGIYFSRAVAIALFMLFPVTEVTAYLFAATLGLLWLSTVPLTAGLVSLFFARATWACLRRRLPQPPGRLLHRRLAGRLRLRPDRRLRHRLVPRHPARPRLGRRPPADPRGQGRPVPAGNGLSQR